MEGGNAALMGCNTWVKQRRREDSDFVDDPSESKEPRYINIGGKATIFMGKGDRLLIQTPGGGGWGRHIDEIAEEAPLSQSTWEARGSFSERAAIQASF